MGEIRIRQPHDQDLVTKQWSDVRSYVIDFTVGLSFGEQHPQPLLPTGAAGFIVCA
jgi:hypothetical protein